MKKLNPFFKKIYLNTHRYNKNHVQVVTGDSGTGKSWSILKMGEELDPTFNVDKITFTPKEFLQAIDNVKKSGEVVALDETGIALSARKWQSLSNMLLNEVIQTFRYQHIICFFIAPDFSYIDSQARKLVNVFSEVKREEESPAEMWIYYLKHDKKTGKPYYYHPIIKNNGAVIKLQKLIFKGRASKEIIKEYETKHKEFKKNLRKKNIKLAELFEQEIKDIKENIHDMVETVVDNTEKYKNVRGKLDWHIIADNFGLSNHKAQKIKILAEKALSHNH
jgi:hypothetical protein